MVNLRFREGVIYVERCCNGDTEGPALDDSAKPGEHMLPKLRRTRDAWRAAMQREWHLWRARRLKRLAEEHGREALKLRDQAAHHEQRAKHFQLQEIRIREGL